MDQTAQPRRFGKYEVIEESGQGRFGVVLKCRDTMLERIVALKVLHPVLLTDPTFKAAFLSEAQKIARLNHPNVVTVHEIGEDQGSYFIVMEYLPRSLADVLLQKHRLPPEEAIALISHVAHGLHAAHEAGLVHRDVKPSNILLDDSGRAKIGDFGLARAVKGSSASSLGLTLSGTAQYVAPERAQGNPADARSDIYSLGIVAYEAITGSTPFKGEDPMAILYQHVHQAPPPMTSFGVQVPASVETAVLRALAKDPTKRYASAHEFANVLRASLQPGAPLQPVERISREGTKGPGEPQPPWVRIAALLVVVCLAVYAVVAYRGTGGRATVTPTPVAAVQRTPTPTVVTPTPRPVPPTATPVPPTATPVPTFTASPVVDTGAIRPAYEITTIDSSAAPAGKGTLQVVVRGAEGMVWKDKWIEVYGQKQDIQGRWVRAERVAAGSTDNTGMASFAVNPGEYIVAVDVTGCNWGDAVDTKGKSSVQVLVGKTTRLVLTIGRLQVGFTRADGSVIQDQWVTVHLQQQDIAGNWVSAGRVASGYTDNTGAVSFDLAPCRYIVGADLLGYPWGTAYDVEGEHNVPIQPGQVTKRVINLGRIIVALKRSDGTADVDRYVRIYAQKTDVAGKPAKDWGVASGYTDNTGRRIVDLTAGRYAIEVSDRTVFHVEVAPGKTTVFDGTTWRIQ